MTQGRAVIRRVVEDRILFTPTALVVRLRETDPPHVRGEDAVRRLRTDGQVVAEEPGGRVGARRRLTAVSPPMID